MKTQISQYTFELVRKHQLPLNQWELPYYLNLISSNYYKLDIIETIALALNKGVSPKNIVIFNDSFSPTFDYYLKGLAIDHNLHILLWVGNPHSLYPNKKVLFLSQVFHLFRELNGIINYERGRKFGLVLDSKYFKQACKIVYNSPSLDSLREVYGILGNHAVGYVESNKSHREISDLVSNMPLTEEQVSEITINEPFDRKSMLESSELPGIVRNHTSRFFDILTEEMRPMVGIIDEAGHLEILGKAHIDKNYSNWATLDYIRISHESPTEIIAVASSLILLIVYAATYVEKEEKIKLLKEQQKTEIERRRGIELENAKKIAEILRCNLNMEKSEISHLTYPHLGTKLSDSQCDIVASSAEMMNKSKMLVHKVDIKV
ncbi:MAG: hypothetical protein PHG06_13050 [Parabacteroides sp.]|nr:hypothetical protein [Parabacteroides sp.]